MFGGYKTCISKLFVKHCEQADHHPEMQHHLEKVEAIEVLDCTEWGQRLHCPEIGTFLRYFNNLRKSMKVVRKKFTAN